MYVHVDAQVTNLFMKVVVKGAIIDTLKHKHQALHIISSTGSH